MPRRRRRVSGADPTNATCGTLQGVDLTTNGAHCGCCARDCLGAPCIGSQCQSEPIAADNDSFGPVRAVPFSEPEYASYPL